MQPPEPVRPCRVSTMRARQEAEAALAGVERDRAGRADPDLDFQRYAEPVGGSQAGDDGTAVAYLDVDGSQSQRRVDRDRAVGSCEASRLRSIVPKQERQLSDRLRGSCVDHGSLGSRVHGLFADHAALGKRARVLHRGFVSTIP